MAKPYAEQIRNILSQKSGGAGVSQDTDKILTDAAKLQQLYIQIAAAAYYNSYHNAYRWRINAQYVRDSVRAGTGRPRGYYYRERKVQPSLTAFVRYKVDKGVARVGYLEEDAEKIMEDHYSMIAKQYDDTAYTPLLFDQGWQVKNQKFQHIHRFGHYEGFRFFRTAVERFLADRKRQGYEGIEIKIKAKYDGKRVRPETGDYLISNYTTTM